MRFVLCALLPLVQATMMALTSSGIDMVDIAQGEFKQVVKLPPDYLGPVVFRNDNTALLGAALAKTVGCLVTVDLSTGNIQEGQHYPDLSFSSLAYDRVTNQTFVIAYNKTEASKVSQLYLLRNQILREIGDIPGCGQFTSAYSSSKHLWFVAPVPGNRLFTIQQGAILHDVLLPVQVKSMTYDDTFGVLYVWGSNSTHAILMSVDPITGTILRTVGSYRGREPGGACVDKSGMKVYSSLIDQGGIFGDFLLETWDLSKSGETIVPTDRSAFALSNQ